MAKQNKKDLAEPEKLIAPISAAKPRSNTVAPPAETASPMPADPPPSTVASISTADPSAPAALTPSLDATDTAASTPHVVAKWRDHVSLWIGIVGTVVTTISLFLAMYFYQASKIRPLLTIGVHPLKTELQRPDHDRELGFIYKGKPVDSESITSVQVSVWNAGTRSIRDSDVLDPIRLVMPDGSVILSVRVKKASRPICAFRTHDNQEGYKSGTCELKWRILEPGDGAVLQVIYAGSARRDPTLMGAVEGQRDGVEVEKYNLTFDRTTILRSNISIARLGSIAGLLTACVLLMFIAIRIHTRTEGAKKLAEERAEAEKHLAEIRKKAVPSPPVAWVLLAAAVVCLFGVLALAFLWDSPPGPPFGW